MPNKGLSSPLPHTADAGAPLLSCLDLPDRSKGSTVGSKAMRQEIGFGRDGQNELVSFTALERPSKKQTCVSVTLLGTPTTRTGSRQERQPLPCRAPTEARSQPPQTRGQEGSQPSRDQREAPSPGRLIAVQHHDPARRPAAPSLHIAPSWGQGHTALGPSQGVGGLGASRSWSYLSGLCSANID